MTKTAESVLFLFSPPMQACYSLSSAPTINLSFIAVVNFKLGLESLINS